MSTNNNWKPLVTKANCTCLSLAGNTYVSKLGNSTLPLQSLIQIQISDDFHFVFTETNQNSGDQAVVLGSWMCCPDGKWRGQGMLPTLEIGTSHFVRYHIQIDPLTLELVYAATLVEDVADACISDTPEEENPAIKVDLQVVYPRCFPKLVAVTPQ